MKGIKVAEFSEFVFCFCCVCQLDKAQIVLQHERASRHKLEHELECLRLENADLLVTLQEVV